LAPGAVDRVLPIEGWTLPGVSTLGGAQILLKDQGTLVGRRIVFCGSSPLLYLAALQSRRMGAKVVGVLDTTAFATKIRSIPQLLASPTTLRRGLGHLLALRRHGVPVRHGVRLSRCEGTTGVEAIVYCDRAGEHRLACDAVAMGFGLRPEIQLAELAGCRLEYDSWFRQWLPACDANGRVAEGVYLAGDGATVGGADAAEISGRLAAYALLEDRGLARASIQRRRLRSRLARLRRFQRGMARAFAWPHEWLGELSDETLVCRCEEISAGRIHEVVSELGAADPRAVKRFARPGMGLCQGRVCGYATACLVASAAGRAVTAADLAGTASRPIAQPVPLAVIAGLRGGDPESGSPVPGDAAGTASPRTDGP
jgi:NADPH-dependent 2,4-dienoyl-CoA reductase/sulfur reductase-like enzyme